MSTRHRTRCVYCQKLNTHWEDATDAAAHCRRCRLPLSTSQHKKWKAVDPDAYIHPLDRQALQGLRSIPGVDTILKKLIGLTSERMHRILFMANSVKVGPEQYAHLDEKLKVVCDTLGMKKPELYVSVSNFGGLEINAFTTGTQDPFIVLYAGLVERLSDRELLAVLAHEMGHIHCQHLLYKSAANTLIYLLASTLGRTPAGALLNTIGLPVKIALIMWSHKAELSCDRTAMLVTQDRDVVMNALIKISGGVLNNELNLEAYLAQAREFDQVYEEGFLDKMWTLLAAAQSSHPFPVWRISEILKWTEDGSAKGYASITAQNDEIRA